MAKISRRRVEKFGHLGLGSGISIMNDPEIKAIAAIMYGNVLGPTGSAKNGDSSWKALAKNASANTAVVKPNSLSDTISSRQVLWIMPEFQPSHLLRNLES